MARPAYGSGRIANMRRVAAIRRFQFEREVLDRGTRLLAGVDEAGRGPLAGPVVAAAVSFPLEWYAGGLPRSLRGLNDSKQLGLEDRERFYAVLTANAGVRYAVARIDAGDIDTLNILRATHRAMSEALDGLDPAPMHVLVDGLPVASLRYPQTAIVGGDALSYTIAAASVLAKVTRDRLMVDYDREFPGYGFAEHKGYGTRRHLAALEALGPCPIHRRSFAPCRPPEPDFLHLLEG
jgi:ribonuclease HII